MLVRNMEWEYENIMIALDIRASWRRRGIDWPFEHLSVGFHEGRSATGSWFIPTR
jgi:hypothetical protein